MQSDQGERICTAAKKTVYPIREGVIAGFVVFLAIGLGAYFVYTRALDQKVSDAKRVMEEIADRLSKLHVGAQGKLESADPSLKDAYRLEINRAYTYLRDNSLNLDRIYTFSIAPETKLTTFETGHRRKNDQTPSGDAVSTPQPVSAEARMAGKILAEGHFPDRPHTIEQGWRFFVFEPLRNEKGTVEAILCLENNWPLFAHQVGELRNALGFALAMGLLIGSASAIVVSQVRDRSLRLALDLSRANEIERAMLGTLGEVVYERSIASNSVCWKGNAEALLGVRPDELSSEPEEWRKQVAPEDLPAFDKAWQKALDTEGPFTLEYRVRRPFGSAALVLDRSRPVRLGNGELLYVGSLLDLTATRQAEDMLRSFFQLTATAMVVFDETGVMDANPAAMRMFGCTAVRDFVEHGLDRFMPPAQPDGMPSAAAWREQSDKARSVGQAHFEWLFHTLSGAELFSDVYLNWAEMDRRHALLMACYDITAAKRAQASLAESERRFRDVSEAVGEFIWEIDCRGLVKFASARVKEILGRDAEHVVGQFMYDFIHPDDQEPLRRRMKVIFDQKLPFRDVECRIVQGDGNVIWASASGTPMLNAAGEVTGYRGASSDITSRHQYEQGILLQKEAAEAADRAKSSFLAVMSHEIRTPLNSVLGFTDLLLHTMLTSQQREYVETIRTSGDGLLLLLNDILDFSKIESGKLEIDMQPTDLQRSVKDILDVHKPTAVSKGLHLAYSMDPTVPGRILTDPARLRQILLNLVGNALKFTASGSVTVLLSVESQGEGNRSFIRFLVRDTGIGIPADKIPRLFQPFSQADSSTTRQYGGTGLGLVISKQLAELLGGRLGLYESSERGTAFFFDVPDTPVRSEPEKPIAPPVSTITPRKMLAAILNGEKPNVLIVDDNAVNRKLAAQLLDQLGARASCAAGAMECLDLIEHTDFDLILMDVQMPDIDGLEATRMIRAREQRFPGSRRVRIAALTADAMAEDRERCFVAGMDDYLSKPIRRRELIEVFRRAVGAGGIAAE